MLATVEFLLMLKMCCFTACFILNVCRALQMRCHRCTLYICCVVLVRPGEAVLWNKTSPDSKP